MQKSASKSKCMIDKIEETTDTFTGRGVMALFVKYLNKIGISHNIDELFWRYKKE